MKEQGADFSLFNIQPMPMEDEVEPVADLSDYTIDGATTDEPIDHIREETLERYRYLCQKDD